MVQKKKRVPPPVDDRKERAFGPGPGFGMAETKQEGAPAQYDRSSPGGNQGIVLTHWMELPLREGMTRKRVHAMVERWLKEHGWTTKPTKNPHV